MIDHADQYFTDGCGRCKRGGTPECSTQTWSSGLETLREICLSAGLDEVVKWGHPCYMHNGKNIVVLGAFRTDFHLSFMNAELIEDAENLFVKRGENTQTANVIKFTETSQPAAMREILTQYLDRAKAAADSGVKPKRVAPSIEMPEELIAALDADPEFAEAFNALTPGRQRGYCMSIGDAKQSATRIARIEKYRPQIFAGKGFNER